MGSNANQRLTQGTPGLNGTKFTSRPLKSQRKQAPRVVILAIALATLAIGLIYRAIGHSPDSADASPGAAADRASLGLAGGTTPRVAIPMLSPLTISWNADLRRDMFDVQAVFPPETRPAVVTPPPPPVQVGPPPPDKAALAQADAKTLHLQGVVAGERPAAMINDELYRVGDKVAGFTVMLISNRRVQIKRDGVLLELYISAER